MRIVGLISGTSLDAIDAALVEVEPAGEPGVLRLAVRAFTMLPYEEALRERIRGLLPPNQGSTAEVCQVGALVGEAFARAARTVSADAGLALDEVDLVASHGQTVWHEVRLGAVPSTLQIGTPAVIAARTGCTVVADFRPADMAVGGQGAPLVPFLDALLFADPRLRRAVQNIGGIGNVTYLAPGAPPRAFDTGPGNVLIDEAVRYLTGGARAFDEDGRMAAAGRVDEGLLAGWLAHPFFDLAPPRSTGRELFGPAEARAMAEAALAAGLRPEDVVATITALTAWSIAEAYQRYCGPVDEVIVSGGGARNPTLRAMIAAALPGAAIRPADEFGLDADAKEAVAFAVLGYATLHGWPANLMGATGAREPVVLGAITPGRNYRALLAAAAAAPADPPGRIMMG